MRNLSVLPKQFTAYDSRSVKRLRICVSFDVLFPFMARRMSFAKYVLTPLSARSLHSGVLTYLVGWT